MGFSKFTAWSLFLLILSLSLLSSTTRSRSHEEQGSITVLISEKGLDFAKNLLIQKAASTVIPLRLPDIEKHAKIPVVGKVHMALSDITIYSVEVASSEVQTGESGVALGVSGATADLSMKWAYSYHTWLVPIAISDDGDASVRVEGMDVRTVFTLEEDDGALHLSLSECSCHVNDISIALDGGASWLYQGIVDAFESQIKSKIEEAVSKKVREKISKLDSLLQSLPKQKQIDEVASLNLTFVSSPVLGDSSIEIEINGLLAPSDCISSAKYLRIESQTSLPYDGPPKMLKISLQEKVLNSATLVYFNANRMQWIVDEVPNQSILNTKEWKLIIPELYQKYPDDNMKLNISVTSPPTVQVSSNGIDADITLDATISVLDSGDALPVACISSVIMAACSGEISKNNLAGSIRLIDFDASLKWSKIGDLGTEPVQSAMSKILEAVFFPYVNTRLEQGFPLPLPHSFSVEDANIVSADSLIMMYADIAYKWLLHKPSV